jgi:ABC-type iron transport system FetAB ATPase subunit
MSHLRIEHLKRPGVDAAELYVDDADCVALHGPSGSGKSMLLRAIADLDEASGEVWLDDRPRSGFSGPAWRRQVIYVAAESRWWDERVRAHATDWQAADLEAVGFGQDVLDWEVQRLSSGERQRLALARALAYAPSALLLDEPSANLDGPNTERIEALVRHWRAHTGGCALWVSHDAEQRARVASASYPIHAGTLGARDDD